jgi:hypothetical protein
LLLVDAARESDENNATENKTVTRVLYLSHLLLLYSLRFNMPGAARRINKSGEVVEGDDAQEDSPLLSGDHRIDVFGFNLDVRQFLITLALAYFMLGQQGCEFL